MGNDDDTNFKQAPVQQLLTRALDLMGDDAPPLCALDLHTILRIERGDANASLEKPEENLRDWARVLQPSYAAVSPLLIAAADILAGRSPTGLI